MYTIIQFVCATGKPLTPPAYPAAPGGDIHSWNYDANLYYSANWKNRGSYKFYILTPDHPDAQFVNALYRKNPIDNHTIAEIILLSNAGDEHAFQGFIDLLEKKQGNPKHKPLWKTPESGIDQRKTEAEQAEDLRQAQERLPQRTVLRKQDLKTQRYRSLAVPHVKLFPLWKTIRKEDITSSEFTEFVNLTKIAEGTLGKGYYGYDQANAQYSTNAVLMLSWYAGKVVYPILQSEIDSGCLTGQPHSANHDLHYARNSASSGGHIVTVFDSAQVLPRYLVMLRQAEHPSSSFGEKLPYCKPGQRDLLFQSDLFYARFILSQYTHPLLALEQGAEVNAVLKTFFDTPSKTVLLLRTNCRKTVSDYIRQSLSQNYNIHRADHPIPLYIDLLQIDHPQKDLIEKALKLRGLPQQAIDDLKKQANFIFILDHFDDLEHKSTLLKSNHLNSPGGFKGKIVMIIQKEVDDIYCRTVGGTADQQSQRLMKYSAIVSAEPEGRSLQSIEKNQFPLLQPRDLKPWLYASHLQYSTAWIDKGAYRLHSLKPQDPDYAFVNTLYQKTSMSGYEVDQVYLVSDRSAEQAFIATLALLDGRHGDPSHQPQWHTEHNPDLRRNVLQYLEENLRVTTPLAPHVQLLPLWHGTGPAAVGGIAQSGFASLALLDAGFGKGLYGSSHAEYSYNVYAKGPTSKHGHGEDGLLLLSWYVAQNTYPVIEGDKDKIEGRANYSNYDSHLIPVVLNPDDPHKIDYDIPRNGQAPQYYEFVTFQTAQVLPRFIISLRQKSAPASFVSPGMEKFLATPDITRLQKQALYQMDILQAFAKLRHVAQEERDEDFMVTQGIASYVETQAADSENERDMPDKHYPLKRKAEEFLNDKSKEVWVLQGNSGAGKSLFGRVFEKELWETNRGWIPLFVSLPSLQDFSDDIVKKALLLKGLPEEAIPTLKAYREFLFVLDGYDEVPGKPRLIQQFRFNEPEQWKGKIIVISRSQHLRSDEAHLLFPLHPKGALQCTESFIVPFTPEHISQYIDNFCRSPFNREIQWRPEDYNGAINQFQTIREFLNEPFMLFLALCALPELQKYQSRTMVRSINLYQIFTKSWFKSQFERLSQHNFDLEGYDDNPEAKVLAIFETYAKNLAFRMLSQNTQTISTTSLEDEDFCRFFSSIEAVRLGFQSCPLKRVTDKKTGNDVYMFMHKSFQEYFVAKKILDEFPSDIVNAQNVDV